MSELLTATIFQVPLAAASTEYSTTFPNGTKHFLFQAQGANDTYFAFEAGQVAGPTGNYATLKSGTVYTAPEKLCLDPNLTLYFGTGASSDVVEIVCYTSM